MPRKTARKQAEEHTHLAALVNRYDVRTGAEINHHAYTPEHAWNLDETEPLYSFATQLELSATATWPQSRAGEAWEITAYDARSFGDYLSATLKDVHERDAKGVHKYRTYRGKEIPVFRPPKGMGYAEKVRGERTMRGWLYVAPRFLSDALLLLGQQRPVYLAIHEIRDAPIRRPGLSFAGSGRAGGAYARP